MEIIRKTPTALKHARATIAFDGTAGGGAVGTAVTIFTITGRVWVDLISAFCTEDLVSAGGGVLEVGCSSDVDAFFVNQTATAIDVNEWVAAASVTPQAGAISVSVPSGGGYNSIQTHKALSANIIGTITVGDITDGTIVFDVWYTPLTDDGKLA